MVTGRDGTLLYAHTFVNRTVRDRSDVMGEGLSDGAPAPRA